MPYIRQDGLTITLSTLGAGSGYCSTILNGLVHSIYVKVSKAVGGNAKVTVTAESTSHVLLIVTNPSTLGVTYYPRSQVVNSTGSVLGSSRLAAADVLHNERYKVAFTSSSGLSGQTLETEIHVY